MKPSPLLLLPLLWLSCTDAPVARPDAFMRIGLPSTETYTPLNEDAPFGLSINAEAKVIVKEVLTEEGTEQAREGEYWLDIVYPSILSTVQFTYKPVDNNLEALVRDAQQLAYKHTVKASGMREQFFEYGIKRSMGSTMNSPEPRPRPRSFTRPTVRNISCAVCSTTTARRMPIA
jgi:gliding motility-associated lipoprotein GldD